jgi:putative transposase
MRYRSIQEQDRRYPIRLHVPSAHSLARGLLRLGRPARESPVGSQPQPALGHPFDPPRVPRAYGSPGIWQALVHRGSSDWQTSRGSADMCGGSHAKTVKKWRVTTDSCHRLPVAANRLDRQFTIAPPNRIWAGDSRTFGSWKAGSISRWWSTSIRASSLAGLLHHSDRGSQYAATAYQQLLTTHGRTGSMSGRGNRWDNACAVSFFGTLKRKLIYHRQYRTRDGRQGTSLSILKCSIIGCAGTPHSATITQAEFEARTAVA